MRYCVINGRKVKMQFLVEREYPAYLTDLFSFGMTDPGTNKRFLELDSQNALTAYEVEGNFYFVPARDAKRQTTAIRRLFTKDPRYLERLVRRCYRIGDEFTRWSYRISRLNVRRLTTLQLYRHISAFSAQYKDLSVFLQSVVWIDQMLKEALDRVVAEKGENPEHNMLVFSSPDKENYDFQEVKSLLRIAISAQSVRHWRHSKKIKKMMDIHVAQYRWIATRGGSKSKPWDRTLISRRVAQKLRKDPVEELQRLIDERRQMRKETARSEKYYRLSWHDKQVVHLVKEYLYLRTYRTDTLSLAAFNVRNLYIELGRRFGLNFWQVMALFENELMHLPDAVPAKRELDRRSRAFYMLAVHGNIIKFHSIKPRLYTTRKAQSVRGQCGNPGRVRGTAKVIRDTADQAKVKNGDILVAVMTFPHLVPAMERAAAFVTDEGGILCHAAIVAREMKKPCIIGTKIATKVFQDGDIVEVDAKKGVVRKIRA